jgi:ribosomal protein L37AE/L43A
MLFVTLAIWSSWKTWTTALLAKGMFGKHMLDAAFGQFRTIVKHVCWKRGKFFAEVDARGTSQECPECEGEVKKDLDVRIHDCPHCSYRTDSGCSGWSEYQKSRNQIN